MDSEIHKFHKQCSYEVTLNSILFTPLLFLKAYLALVFGPLPHRPKINIEYHIQCSGLYECYHLLVNFLLGY